MPQGGKITVLASKEGENIVLEFLDEGPGIPKNLHESIFEPLYTTKPTGTGLGLVSCKNIVKQHGGSISVSNNPTNFTIKIPSNQKHAELVPDIMRK